MKLVLLLLSAAFTGTAMAQVHDFLAADKDFVLEKLGPRIRKPAAQAELIPAVRQAITLARQSADPRYLGEAQAMIGPLWSSPKANHDLLTLQATIEQSRHEFASARKTLRLALGKPADSHAQAWLTLAAIERVQGQYAEAEKACKRIEQNAAQLYARACLLETISLQGQWETARSGYLALLREPRLPMQRAWLHSLQAENELRAGQDGEALKYFASSLAIDNDGYTALVYADVLLARQQAEQALAVLQSQPESDGVLIRRATAYKQLKDPRFNTIARTLQVRMSAMAQRKDNAGHAREQALHALHVLSDAKAALAFAQMNLQQQREPIDWRIAIQSAQQAGQAAEKAKLLQAAAKTGLKDASWP